MVSYIIDVLRSILWWAIDSEDKYKLPFIDPGFQHEVTPLLLTTSIVLLFIGTPLVAALNLALFTFKRHTSNDNAPISIDYYVKHPHEQDIDGVVEFGRRLVGEHHIDLEILKRRFSINQRIITCLYDSKSDNKLIGYFIVYPLTKTAFNLIMAGELRNGREIRDEYICKRFENASAIYIGMVGGVGMHAEGYVISELLETLRVLIRNEKLKAIFTRGATNDGIRVVDLFGFQKLASPSEISALFNNSELFNHPRIRRHFKSNN